MHALHALTLARQRLRARLQSPSVPRAVRLAHGLLEDGRARFIPILSSPLAQDILSHGYDARTLDRIYSGRPAEWAGPLGRLADCVVQGLPLHRGLRERQEATAGEIYAAAVVALRRGEPEFRALCAPCGLAGELLTVAERARTRCPELKERARFWGLDPDPEGNLLPETARRLRTAGLRAHVARGDLRTDLFPDAVAAQEGPFHLVCLVGLSQHLPAGQVGETLARYARLLAPGGTLLTDRWEPGEPSRLARELGMPVRTDRAPEFYALLRQAGLTVEREHPAGEGGCVLVVARRA